MDRKGVILAGGSGSRLFPITKVVNKHLLPIYNKPMIYYSLTTLMLAGIRQYLLISTPDDIGTFEKLLGNGKQWGIRIKYEIQKTPGGIAEAFIIGRKFLANSNSALILGDNIFYGNDLTKILAKANKNKTGATIFPYPVKDPTGFGVVEFSKEGKVIKIEEKPNKPKSNYVVPGLYFYDQDVLEIVKTIEPSTRGELEITDVNNQYLKKKKLTTEILGRGIAWLDTGTPEGLHKASSFVCAVEDRQGMKIACPDEISKNMNFK
jgi:glucose-1-phosphate thymidylyltransferase